MARYLPIAEHGLIGDLDTAALVGTAGNGCPGARVVRRREEEEPWV